MRETARRLNRSHNVAMNFLKTLDQYVQDKNRGVEMELSPRSQRLTLNTVNNSSKTLNQIKSKLQLDMSRECIELLQAVLTRGDKI